MLHRVLVSAYSQTSKPLRIRTAQLQGDRKASAVLGTDVSNSTDLAFLRETLSLLQGLFMLTVNADYGSVIVWMVLQLQMWEIKSWHVPLSVEPLSRLPAKCHQPALGPCHRIRTVAVTSIKLTWSEVYFSWLQVPCSFILHCTNSTPLSISTFRCFSGKLLWLETAYVSSLGLFNKKLLMWT